LCAEDNMQVVNCTTPGQYFHVLRRQMYGGDDRRGVRKPLVIFTPKSLLRHPKAVSQMRDFTTGSFREVLGDEGSDPASVSRLLLSTGKIHYDLAAAREERQTSHIAIARLEQLYPFPQEAVRELLALYGPGCEVCWVQEEPRNMGAWRFVEDHLRPLLAPTRREPRYIGRHESASTAAGSLKRHQHEQSDILEESFAAGEVARKGRVRLVARRKAK
jgi:2-oxoglutarate dehydrogenase E1 component